MTRPTIVVTEHLEATPSAWLEQQATVIRCSHDDDCLPAALADADGLVVRTYTRVNPALLDLAPRLRVVARAGAGLDNIDLPACRERHVAVVYAPGANSQAVVEYVWMLISDAFRPRIPLTTTVAAEAWRRLRARTPDRQLSDCTLGILGLGRIGRRVARVASAFNMTVAYHDLLDIPEEHRHGAQPRGFEDVLRDSDILTVHIDGRTSNRHLLDAAALAHCRPDVVLINAARGFIIDPRALASFLNDHPQAQALLDVHDPEPFDADYPLLACPNARLYPHLASRTRRAMDDMSWVVRDVMAVLEGRAPEHPAPH